MTMNRLEKEVVDVMNAATTAILEMKERIVSLEAENKRLKEQNAQLLDVIKILKGGND